MRGVVVLLPPSEGKAPGGTRAPWRPGSGRFGRRLGRRRTEVAEALAAAGGGDAKLLGVSGAHLERAQAANASVVGAPTLPAVERFTGVVWEHLDVTSLGAADRRRAAERIVVVNALTGASGLDDPLPDFRLKLSASLPPIGRLAAHWRPTLSEVLNDALAGSLVVDLLPAEHAAAWEPDTSCVEVVAVDLVDDAGRRVGHAAKAAKGLLARALVSAPTAAAARRLLEGGWEGGGFRGLIR
jgi:cytoplasmic iron level regulating protein YaaA (DUF328/UPF0246 family)